MKIEGIYKITKREYKAWLKLVTMTLNVDGQYKLVLSEAFRNAIEDARSLFDSDVWKEHFCGSASANWDNFFYTVEETETFCGKIEYMCHCMEGLVDGSEYTASSKDYVLTLRESCLPSGWLLTQLTTWMQNLRIHGDVMHWSKKNEDKGDLEKVLDPSDQNIIRQKVMALLQEVIEKFNNLYVMFDEKGGSGQVHYRWEKLSTENDITMELEAARVEARRLESRLSGIIQRLAVQSTESRKRAFGARNADLSVQLETLKRLHLEEI